MDDSTKLASADINAARLGKADSRFTMDTREDNARAALALISDVRNAVDIFTPDLEPHIYDRSDFLDRLTMPPLGRPRAHVRVLVKDSQCAVKNGHRLIELTRKLSSYMEIRRVPRDLADYDEAFMLVDNCGVMRRRVPARFAGTVCFNDPNEVTRLKKIFDEIWERSNPDPEMRRLNL